MATEKRLIDATDWDSFYADMGDSRNTMDSYDRGYTDALDRVDDWMDTQPTVDAVEVVRCKDCKLEGTEKCPMVHRDLLFGNLYAETKPDAFCSYGERRTDERKAD